MFSTDSKPSPQEAAEAAAKIIGCYPEITASDPHRFTAGLVQTLMAYPSEIAERATHPVHGILGIVDRYDLTLARIRKHLDAWTAERSNRITIEERRKRQLLPSPAEEDAEAKQRVSDGFEKLKFRLEGLK